MCVCVLTVAVYVPGGTVLVLWSVAVCSQSHHTHNSDPGRSHSFEVLITRIVDCSLRAVDWG